MFRLRRTISQFVTDWLFSRSYRDLKQGFPAALVMILLIVGFIFAARAQEAGDFSECVRSALEAFQHDDKDLAELYLRKARVTDGGSDQWRFRQAILLEQLGKHSDSVQIMARLAPDDLPVYVPAHLWMVGHLTQEMTNLETRDDTNSTESAGAVQRDDPSLDVQQVRAEYARRAIKHLKSVLELEPDHQAAHEKLATVRIQQRDYQAAANHLSQIVDRQPRLRSVHANALLEIGEQEQARQQARKAAEDHRQMLETTELAEQERVEHLLDLCRSLTIDRQFEQAAKSLLVNGKPPQDERLRGALHTALFLWSESITERDVDSLTRKMTLLDNALKLRPNNEAILLRIAKLAESDGEVGDRARSVLKEMLASGKAPSIIHLILGVRAIKKKDGERAIKHWELAHQANPNVPMTLNSLAILVSRRDPPDLKRALTLIDTAIELKPEVHELYDSRGQIYLAMNDYTNAIADFERAIGRLPGRADIHERLASAYARLGDKELARIHADRAKKIRLATNDPGTAEN